MMLNTFIDDADTLVEGCIPSKVFGEELNLFAMFFDKEDLLRENGRAKVGFVRVAYVRDAAHSAFDVDC